MSSVVLIQEELLEICLPMLIDREDNAGTRLRPDKGSNDWRLRKSRTSSAENNNPNEINRPSIHTFNIQGNHNFNSISEYNRRINSQFESKQKFSIINKPDEEIKKAKERVTILAIAYHNMAVELEHMKQYEESMEVYQKACTLSAKLMGNDNGLVENLKEVAETATIHLTEKLNKKPNKKKFVLKTKKIQSAVAKPIQERNARPKPKSEYVPRPRIVSNYGVKINIPGSNEFPALDMDEIKDDTIEELSVSSHTNLEDSDIKHKAKTAVDIEKKKIRGFAKSSGDVLRNKPGSLIESGKEGTNPTSPNKRNSVSNSNNTLNRFVSDNINNRSGKTVKSNNTDQNGLYIANTVSGHNFDHNTIPEAPELTPHNHDTDNPADETPNLPGLKITPAQEPLKQTLSSFSNDNYQMLLDF